MRAQLVLAQYLLKNNKEVRELSVMRAKIWVKSKKGILKLRKKHWQLFGCAIVSMCTCTVYSTEFELYTDQKPFETIFEIKAMHKNLAMDPEATTLQVQS